MDDSSSGKIAPSFHHPFSKFIEFIMSGHRSKIQILYAFFREEKDSTSGGHEFQVASVAFGVFGSRNTRTRVLSLAAAKSIFLSDN